MGSNPDERLPKLFANYEPAMEARERAAPINSTIRTSVPSDRDAMAEIAWRRNGGLLADFAARFERDLRNHPNSPDDLWLTALVEDRVVGYGKVSRVAPPEHAPANRAPAGFYLGGVTVHEDFRRRGIGHELTRQRLLWIASRATEAFYFANAQNLASIDLHARFGFVEVTRDFFVPGVTFIGGVGILFRADLRMHLQL